MQYLINVMMEAVCTSETSVYSCELHGGIYQTAVIFILATVRI
jgi:hypothetical protein